MVAIMAGAKKAAKKRKVLNTSEAAGDLVMQVAAMRKLTVEELFDQRDVQEFFRHLLLAELRKVEQHLRGQK
jgi:hypothetical protein